MILNNGNFIHPLAFVDPTAKIGVGACVWQFASILADVVLGSDCNVGSNAEIGRKSVIGSGTRISHGVFLPAKSKIGERVFIGPNATLTDDKWPRCGNDDYVAQPPILEDECAIGAGAVILPGVRIGKGAMIGAGAVVVKDVAPGTVVRGDRAREYLDGLRSLRREAGQGYDQTIGECSGGGARA